MSRRAFSTIAAAALVATTFAVPTASAQTGEVDCSANKFAVGGYPRTDIVPAGYQYIPTPGGIFAWERGGYARGQAEGSANVISTLDAFAAACPGVRIDIQGHSYGAAIVATALETIDTRPYAPQVNVALTGNPRRAGGIEDNFRGFNLFGLQFRGAAKVPVNVGSYVDRCNPRDGICNLPPLIRNPIGFLLGIVGYFTGAHRYPSFPANPETPTEPVIPPIPGLTAPGAPAAASVAPAPALEEAPAPEPAPVSEAAPEPAPVLPTPEVEVSVEVVPPAASAEVAPSESVEAEVPATEEVLEPAA